MQLRLPPHQENWRAALNASIEVLNLRIAKTSNEGEEKRDVRWTLDMSKVWERILERGFRDVEYSVKPQKTWAGVWRKAGYPNVRPDLVVSKDNEGMVFDAKYQKLPIPQDYRNQNTNITTKPALSEKVGHLYQVFAYANVYSAENGVFPTVVGLIYVDSGRHILSSAPIVGDPKVEMKIISVPFPEDSDLVSNHKWMSFAARVKSSLIRQLETILINGETKTGPVTDHSFSDREKLTLQLQIGDSPAGEEVSSWRELRILTRDHLTKIDAKEKFTEWQEASKENRWLIEQKELSGQKSWELILSACKACGISAEKVVLAYRAEKRAAAIIPPASAPSQVGVSTFG